jgi:hypothetical protein
MAARWFWGASKVRVPISRSSTGSCASSSAPAAGAAGWACAPCPPIYGPCSILVGLVEVLALEAGGEARRLEELGIDEVVQPGDPPC